MFAVKSSWVGQTFALANSNGSGGKKSRIRKSKEDRKEMVESFIKRYQNLNSGSFPSLNLTHKEVGGSFYTVREIVREVIQENRVLGPAKPSENEQEVDRFSEQYPLGLISMDFQSHASLMPNGTHVASNDDQPNVVSSDEQNISMKMDSTLNGKVNGQQLQRPVSQQYINGTLANKEYIKADGSEHPVQLNHGMPNTDVHIINQSLGSVEDIVELSTPEVTLMETDVLVETFPINFARNITQDVDGSSVEAGKLVVNLEQQETERVEVNLAPSESGYSVPYEEKSVIHFSDQLYENSSSSTANSITSTLGSNILHADVAVEDESTLQMVPKQDPVVEVLEPKPASKNVHSKSTYDASMNQDESLSEEADLMKTKSENQNTLSTEEGKYSTLNRTKLRSSWEGSSRRTAETETNPVLAAFKAFFSAFVKFWTE